jgi:hypothetical protein
VGKLKDVHGETGNDTRILMDILLCDGNANAAAVMFDLGLRSGWRWRTKAIERDKRRRLEVAAPSVDHDPATGPQQRCRSGRQVNAR